MERTRLNQAIIANELRVIDAEGKQIGVMTKQEAIAQARAAGLDLVEISPLAKPPVAKIVDWGKYSYHKAKQDKKNRLKNKSELKEIRLSLKIGQHDLDTRLRQASVFLEEGNQLKISVFFRGREITRKEFGYEVVKKFLAQLESVKIVREPHMEGRTLATMVVADKKKE